MSEGLERAVAIDALRDLLLAGGGFRLAVAEHFDTGTREIDAVGWLHARGELTVEELARLLHLSSDGIVDLLDRLESAGLAYRRPVPGDERRVTVHPTERAQRLITEVRGWLALCLDLLPEHSRAVRTFAVLGHGLGSLRDELRNELRVESGAGLDAETPDTGRDGSRRGRAIAGADLLDVDRPAGRSGLGDIETLRAALARADLVLRVSHALAAQRDEAAIAASVSTALREHLGARFVGISLIDPGRQTMRYVSLDPLPEPTQRQFASFPLDDTFPAGATAMYGRAYFHGSVAAAEGEFPGIGEHLVTAKVAAIVHLPLLAGSDVIGTLAVGWDHTHDVDIDDQGLLTVVAGYAAQALRRV